MITQDTLQGFYPTMTGVTGHRSREVSLIPLQRSKVSGRQRPLKRHSPLSRYLSSTSQHAFTIPNKRCHYLQSHTFLQSFCQGVVFCGFLWFPQVSSGFHWVSHRWLTTVKVCHRVNVLCSVYVLRLSIMEDDDICDEKSWDVFSANPTNYCLHLTIL